MYSESGWIALSHTNHVLSNTLVFPLIPWPHVIYHEITSIYHTDSATT